MDSEIIAAIIGFGGAILGSAITFLAAQIPLNYFINLHEAAPRVSHSVKLNIVAMRQDTDNLIHVE